jgi:type IV pilus assembly protein PilO
MGKLTKQQQQIIAIVFVFVIGGGYVYWNYLLKPTLDSISVRKQKYEELQAKIETAERQARRLPALQNELALLQTDLTSLEKQLPKDKDIPNILRTLTREAMQESLQFVRLAPKPPARQQYFDILPFEVQFNGNLHAFARFLASLGQQDRIFQAQNIQLSPAGSGASESSGLVNLSISLTIQTYAYAG